jgi:glycosyltransferase involved in cell wall biosynthesis
MKIGLDISQIVYKGTGVSRFTEGLVRAILDYDNQHYWTFFFSSFRQHLDEKIKNDIYQSNYQLLEWFIPPTVLSRMWNDGHSASARLRLYPSELDKLDWFLTSDWSEPPLKTKKATIVHDLVFKKYPETVHESILHTQEKRLHWIAKESACIFTDSKQTANDLVKYYPRTDKKVHLNYPGVDMSQIIPSKNTLKKYGLPSSYILTVGKREPRKNTERLIQAYLALDAPNRPDLVIVGMPGWGTSEYTDPHIHYLGYVPDEDLASLYADALFFVLPSLYEGFGYPVIEAMIQGCPVAVSDSSSLRELAGDAGVLFDPESISSIQKALHSLITNETLRKNLKEKGLKRSKEFSWKNYYDTLVKTLSDAV